jgi:tyrosinase
MFIPSVKMFCLLLPLTKDLIPFSYWDWSRDWKDPTKSPIWDPVTGFGGDGDPDGPVTVGRGSCIKDGPFAGYQVLYSDFVPQMHCLSRGFGRQLHKPFRTPFFEPQAMVDLLNQKTFYNFTEAMEEGPHDAVPNGVNGDFFTLESPNGKLCSVGAYISFSETDQNGNARSRLLPPSHKH